MWGLPVQVSMPALLISSERAAVPPLLVRLIPRLLTPSRTPRRPGPLLPLLYLLLALTLLPLPPAAAVCQAGPPAADGLVPPLLRYLKFATILHVFLSGFII